MGDYERETERLQKLMSEVLSELDQTNDNEDVDDMTDSDEEDYLETRASGSDTEQEILDTEKNIEYIIQVEDIRPDFKWDNSSTKVLIDLYKKYKKKVGTIEVKNVKAMWLIIAKELEVALKKPVPANCCENRCKVLDRNYKKFVENKTSTGRGRKYFEFTDEMAELFMGKKSVVPQLLLSTSTIHEPEVESHMATDESIKERETTTVTNSIYV
ncbi:myb/sant-like dna-binding domain [Holotrichia oblita]|uniref:Myb/sant-like dna-binding domain n=1 Tax=Holotrichia oblita TaxID=644536 RepID=A0ACB9TWL1_HOLOL|nr:myb/sant-like dna-binding domain [Holotrichia oblita]